MGDIYILGVGHNTPVYIDLVETCGYRIKGLYHYNSSRTNEEEHGYKIIGSFQDLFSLPSLKGMKFALSQGDNKIRADLFEKILSKEGEVPQLIHPSATVSRFAKLGNGVIIHANSIVYPDVVVGDNTVVETLVILSHNAIVGSNSFFAPGALIGAYTNIEDFVFIGIGAIIISGKVDNIGNNAYVGAGALVTKSVPSNCVVAGNPARVIREIEQ